MLLGLRKPIRLLWGYVAACALMGFVLACVAAWTVPETAAPELFVLTIALTKVAMIVSILPSLVVIPILEWRGMRRWYGYAIFGATLSAVASVLISGGMERPQTLNLITIFVCFAFLGAASATVYWWIAGRFAGQWSGLNEPE
ncbi:MULTISPECIES: hypothetical protein [Rhizobium]|uniref:Uncharacterized protein n=1 Tax=Rhizobium tropici TaxID=398 RepID=A0A6P1C2V6_RHITR|nr:MULTISPECIES: hypothetical protein [Rhizobium]MBB4241062.1 hypothetical protein [Rhizobium tropici]MBB5592391.1 hypothetical protein [Rhizobium tropici]MBB6491387.1 hypothetical protein [Rhizobium tropici]NEV10562.1 hypothetical protein [Rhizobium tropici]TGE94772.1 hypothetical protein C9417_23190 [Rhizobium sp. SEMIA 4088]